MTEEQIRLFAEIVLEECRKRRLIKNSYDWDLPEMIEAVKSADRILNKGEQK